MNTLLETSDLIEGEELVELAKQALKRPSYSSWWYTGMFHTHGFSGFSQHRDSDLLERCNFIAIQQEIETSDWSEDGWEGNDEPWEVLGASHWAVGHADFLVCRVLNDPDSPITEENITGVFQYLVTQAQYIAEQYPILDEDLYAKMEWTEAIETVENYYHEDVFDSPDREFDAEAIVYHVVEMSATDLQNPREEEVRSACWDLGFVSDDPEYWEEGGYWYETTSAAEAADLREWVAACAEIERERTQTVLFDKGPRVH